ARRGVFVLRVDVVVATRRCAVAHEGGQHRASAMGHTVSFTTRAQVRRQAAFLACAAVALLSSSSQAQRLLFTGDILLSRQVRAEIDRRHASPWRALDTLFRAADWIGGNFEGAIGDASACEGGASTLCFATPTVAAGELANAGFKTLTVENNHA